MHQGESSEWRAIAGAVGLDGDDLERLLPALNALGKAFLTQRVSLYGATSRPLTVADLPALGVKASDLRKLLDGGLVRGHGKNAASRRILVTGAGLTALQAAIPLGAIRPAFDHASHQLLLAGRTILKPSVQGRNLSTVLASLETAGWARRVERPLAGRRCADDPHSLRAVTSTLTKRQRVIEFHAHDGAVTWNWRVA